MLVWMLIIILIIIIIILKKYKSIHDYWYLYYDTLYNTLFITWYKKSYYDLKYMEQQRKLRKEDKTK